MLEDAFTTTVFLPYSMSLSTIIGDPNGLGSDAPGGSVTDQTKNILDRIDALLSDAGTGKSSLITATIWLSDMSDFNEMNAVWDAWVTPGDTPV